MPFICPTILKLASNFIWTSANEVKRSIKVGRSIQIIQWPSREGLNCGGKDFMGGVSGQINRGPSSPHHSQSLLKKKAEAKEKSWDFATAKDSGNWTGTGCLNFCSCHILATGPAASSRWLKSCCKRFLGLMPLPFFSLFTKFSRLLCSLPSLFVCLFVRLFVCCRLPGSVLFQPSLASLRNGVIELIDIFKLCAAVGINFKFFGYRFKMLMLLIRRRGLSSSAVRVKMPIENPSFRRHLILHQFYRPPSTFSDDDDDDVDWRGRCGAGPIFASFSSLGNGKCAQCVGPSTLAALA